MTKYEGNLHDCKQERVVTKRPLFSATQRSTGQYHLFIIILWPYLKKFGPNTMASAIELILLFSAEEHNMHLAHSCRHRIRTIYLLHF